MLGEMLRSARGQRTLVQVALGAGISPETLRKIETGRIATPSFMTVAALAEELALSLDDIQGTLRRSSGETLDVAS